MYVNAMRNEKSRNFVVDGRLQNARWGSECTYNAINDKESPIVYRSLAKDGGGDNIGMKNY